MAAASVRLPVLLCVLVPGRCVVLFLAARHGLCFSWDAEVKGLVALRNSTERVTVALLRSMGGLALFDAIPCHFTS